MARKIFISSDMSEDEALDEVAEENPLSALLWPWMLTFFDDWGRAEASPRRIKNRVFPSDAFMSFVTIGVIEESLQLYAKRGLITFYQVSDKRLMYVDPETWFKWQTHIRTSKRDNDNSKHPAPMDANIAQVRESAREVALLSDTSLQIQPSPSPSLSLSLSKESSNGNNSRENIFGIYEQEIGPLTRIISEKLVDLEEFYSEDWVKRAISVAVFAGEKKMRFIEGILSKWKALNHTEPWTVIAPSQPNTKQHSNYNRGSPRQGTSHKPIIPIISDNGSPSKPRSSEHEAYNWALARKLDGDPITDEELESLKEKARIADAAHT